MVPRLAAGALLAGLLGSAAFAAPLDWRFGIEDTWGQLGDIVPWAWREALAAKLEPLTQLQPTGGDVNINGLAGGWRGMQPTPDAQIGFTQSDELVQRLQQHGFSMLWNLAINSDWASVANPDCYATSSADDCAPDAEHEQALYDYVRGELKFESDLPYEILSGYVHPWSYKEFENSYVHVAETLRAAMTANPHLKVFVANGYYDLGTPYFATEYTFNHLGLEESLRGNVSMEYYDAGHMMYIHLPSLKQMKKDLAKFIKGAMNG